MNKIVLASTLDLPFYFRLPSIGFFTWDPDCDVAIIHPKQRAGEVSFSKTCKFVDAQKLLDAPCSHLEGPTNYEYLLKCEGENGIEISTLHINTKPTGGFTEFRAYSEVTIFIIVEGNQNSLTDELIVRTFQVLNHFIDIYRIITQDPFVHRIDEKHDTYLVDFSFGSVPEQYNNSPINILKNIQSIPFSKDIGKGRELKLRLNSLEDLFPGKILKKDALDNFSKLIKTAYNMPLHYELIFTAQVELKRRNYHIAILEAETAFETYITATLLEISVSLGMNRDLLLADFENPKKLGLLSQRLKKLDSMIHNYRKLKALESKPTFIESTIYAEWKNHLYKIRNKIVHEGWRFASFDLAKQGIAVCKSAIKEIEDRLPGISNLIQIYPGVDHLQDTSGRLKF
jgi:hypothetical protein